MAPSFERASIELDYPLYTVDFDSEDANRIVVGGGGGAGRSGVGNKITVLETPTRTDMQSAGDIVLSRDEDSVMSLALGPRKGKTTYLYAGVNSSPAAIAKGNNEHLRTLAIEQSKSARPSTPNSKGPSAKIAELSRTSMFTDSDEAAYQRLLRVSGSIGAAATAMGKEPQLGVFEATGPNPKIKGVIELAREAEDLDVIQTGDNEFQVAFCYKYELHVVNVGKGKSEPELVFTMPEDNGERPMFRSIRYLSSEFILAVSNLPKKNGVILQGLRLPSPGHDTARLAATARIPQKINATAVSITNLSPPSTPTSPIGETQFVIAVAGNDSAIYLYTLGHTTTAKLTLLANLHPLTTLKDPQSSDNITGLSFSTFVTPKSTTRSQFIKLASISLQSAVSVYSIPLKKYVDKTPRNPKGPPRATRYVVAMKSKAPAPRSLIFALSVMVVILAVLGQGLLEVFGGSRPILHIHKVLPSRYGSLRTPENQPEFFAQDAFVSKLVGDDIKMPDAGETLVLLDTVKQPGEGEEPVRQIQVDIHQDDVHGEAKRWDDLPEEHKEAWREKLSEAGKWTRDIGEGVFKGILFGELAEAAGHAFAG